MSNTVLGFWDFFWIWFIIVVMAGVSRLIEGGEQLTGQIKALETKVAELTEEVRKLRG
jgi:Sec-independent protein translocase protein TatA